jgi:hypothetical protein
MFNKSLAQEILELEKSPLINKEKIKKVIKDLT